MSEFPPERLFAESKLRRFDKLSEAVASMDSGLLIYDRVLEKNFGSVIKKFPLRYAVRSGEELKELEKFPGHMKKILKLVSGLGRSELRIYVLGGGSVGDFGGLVASLLKRGVPVIQIPSTWLAAVDSAHGGKTALNVAGFKNQIGTFWPARECWLVKDLLFSQPEERLEDAFSEVLKMGLLRGGSLGTKIFSSEFTADFLFKILPDLIAAKWRVVLRDPFEAGGYRGILNLGHTIGHIFEAHKGWSHGKSVLYGLRFALEYSVDTGVMKRASLLSDLKKHPLYPSDRDFHRELRMLKRWRSYLIQDKKMVSSGLLNFIFLEGAGRPIQKKVSLDDIGAEIRRQLQVAPIG